MPVALEDSAQADLSLRTLAAGKQNHFLVFGNAPQLFHKMLKY